MWGGEIILGAFGLANLIWSLFNWMTYKRTLKSCATIESSAEGMRQRAYDLLRAARLIVRPDEDGFRVCKACGKIVEGPCQDCVVRALKAS